MQPPYHTAIESSVDDAATLDAWNAAFEKPERPLQAVDFVDKPETNDPRRFVNAKEAVIRDLVFAEVVTPNHRLSSAPD